MDLYGWSTCLNYPDWSQLTRPTFVTDLLTTNESVRMSDAEIHPISFFIWRTMPQGNAMPRYHLFVGPAAPHISLIVPFLIITNI